MISFGSKRKQRFMMLNVALVFFILFTMLPVTPFGAKLSSTQKMTERSLMSSATSQQFTINNCQPKKLSFTNTKNTDQQQKNKKWWPIHVNAHCGAATTAYELSITSPPPSPHASSSSVALTSWRTVPLWSGLYESYGISDGVSRYEYTLPNGTTFKLMRRSAVDNSDSSRGGSRGDAVVVWLVMRGFDSILFSVSAAETPPHSCEGSDDMAAATGSGRGGCAVWRYADERVAALYGATAADFGGITVGEDGAAVQRDFTPSIVVRRCDVAATNSPTHRLDKAQFNVAATTAGAEGGLMGRNSKKSKKSKKSKSKKQRRRRRRLAEAHDDDKDDDDNNDDDADHEEGSVSSSAAAASEDDRLLTSKLLHPAIGREMGEYLAEEYDAAEPWPGITLDSVLKRSLMSKALDFLRHPIGDGNNVINWNGKGKRGGRKGHDVNSVWVGPEEVVYCCKQKYRLDFKHWRATKYARALQALTSNSRFIAFLEGLTGIHNLLPMRVHEEKILWAGSTMIGVKSGGYLLVHNDFNLHEGLHRRINVLLYLNEYWEEEWQGHLELWSRNNTRCVQRIPPVFNRMSIFTVTDDAFHGHPEPLQTPPDDPDTGEETNRYALQIVYYTKEPAPSHNSAKPGAKRQYAPFHGAIFQPECEPTVGLRKFCEAEKPTDYTLKCQCNYRFD